MQQRLICKYVTIPLNNDQDMLQLSNFIQFLSQFYVTIIILYFYFIMLKIRIKPLLSDVLYLFTRTRARCHPLRDFQNNIIYISINLGMPETLELEGKPLHQVTFLHVLATLNNFRCVWLHHRGKESLKYGCRSIFYYLSYCHHLSSSVKLYVFYLSIVVYLFCRVISNI